MEILLKMKQAGNAQFNFLSYDNELHSYYRHMMTAIKNGRYKQSTQAAEDRGNSWLSLKIMHRNAGHFICCSHFERMIQDIHIADSDASKSESMNENTYLHPSLVPSSTVINSSVPVRWLYTLFDISVYYNYYLVG